MCVNQLVAYVYTRGVDEYNIFKEWRHTPTQTAMYTIIIIIHQSSFTALQKKWEKHSNILIGRGASKQKKKKKIIY